MGEPWKIALGSPSPREVAATRFDTSCNRESGFWNLESEEKSGERAEFTFVGESNCRHAAGFHAVGELGYGGMRRI